jgi:hypothetical protein
VSDLKKPGALKYFRCRFIKVVLAIILSLCYYAEVTGMESRYGIAIFSEFD